MKQVKYLIPEDDIPDQWYNILADLPEPMEPPLNPQTKEPVGPEDLSAIFPDALIAQEVSSERYIDIPDEVLQYSRQWRPSPVHRARRLEKLLDTPAHIYYKYEGSSPVGSHKLNTAIAGGHNQFLHMDMLVGHVVSLRGCPSKSITSTNVPEYSSHYMAASTTYM